MANSVFLFPSGFSSGGPILLSDGTVTSPGLSFTSDPDTGFYSPGPNAAALTLGGVLSHFWGVGFYDIRNNAALFRMGVNSDVVLGRDGAGILALRDGINAQRLNIYGTYTNASNFETGFLAVGSAGFYVGTSRSGTGAARPIIFATNGVDRFRFSIDGHLLAETDNTYDIGANGVNRPRNIFSSGSISAVGELSTSGYVTSGAGQGFYIGSRGYLRSPDVGILTWSNAALTNTYTTTVADWGTTLSAEAVSVANDGILFLGTSAVIGILTTTTSTGAVAQFNLGGNSSIIVSGSASFWSITKDTAAKTNIYYDAAGPSGAGYYIQNKLGSTVSYRNLIIGV